MFIWTFCSLRYPKNLSVKKKICNSEYKDSWAPNQHYNIKQCDTEVWSNGWWNLALHHRNKFIHMYICKYICKYIYIYIYIYILIKKDQINVALVSTQCSVHTFKYYYLLIKYWPYSFQIPVFRGIIFFLTKRGKHFHIF